MSRPPRAAFVRFCPVDGKRCYTSKRAAKLVARAEHPGEHLSAYKCGEYWHIGHLPEAVKSSELDRRDLPNRRRAEGAGS